MFVGIDVGSATTKAVFLSTDREVRAARVVPTGMRAEQAVAEVINACLADTGEEEREILYCVATGYGRELVAFAQEQVTEISCHARGARALFPKARTIIDIGGQDSKVISLDAQGRVVSFTMNDKCAAGTGRFLEVMARTMGMDAQEMGYLSLRARRDVPVSSVCTVFAESEVVSLIAKGVDPADIVAGLHRAVARRVAALAGQVGVVPPVVMSGGVAKNLGVRRALEESLGTEFLVPENPQIVGALGAAYIAAEKYESLR